MTDHEKSVLEGLIDRTVTFAGETVVVKRGEYMNHSMLLIEGFMLRTIEADGKEAIVGLQVPGDFVDLHAFALKRLDHDLKAVGRVTVGYVPHERLQQVMLEEPHLARLFWFSTLLDASIHREWIRKVGQLRAMGKVAHFICEIWYRLRMVELGKEAGFQTPFSQIHLANMCGMSTIHVSRTMKDLREAGMMEFRRGRVIIHDGEKLKKIASFDPAYLYGEGGLEVGHALDLGADERALAK
ncbi:Crp/Fnr family transcriptional regulator [Alteripontixanthobacter maritimus]|nr:Crp/Fnr family transcriptional regulator [Alteripontixanthobacter maritimus]